ncbi:membrane protein [Xenorhabdus sp. TS4]|nr:membrane protein [Xenorhabdus sp. TS4]
MWVLMGIIYGAINLSLFISDFGFLLCHLLDPLFSAGIIAICETQIMTGKFKFGTLFYGLHYKCSALLAIGIIVCGIKI